MSLDMQMKIRALLLLAAGTLITAEERTVVVRPVEIDSVLTNPGMGIQTFQRFRGQALNVGQRWSETGPEKPVADAAGKVRFPDSSMAYLRWFWWRLEPKRGEYRWEIIDSALDEARRHGQTLNIRLMPYDQTDAMPEWYRNSGARRANRPEDKDGKIWSPDANDPRYAKWWSELVREAGRRYDGNPWLELVDISTVGFWGEGWGPYLPDWKVQKELIDVYFEAFPHTALLVNFDELKALEYGTRRGAGWRLDCWGDMGAPGRSFAHMRDMYPQQVARANLGDVWRRSPVSLETCWTPGTWKQWGFDLKPIFDQALRWHASTINLKSSAIPEQWQREFDEFQKQIGYRFVLKRLEYPSPVKAGQVAPVKMWWFNAGVSPCYRPYVLALEIGGAQARLDADIRSWLPGDSVCEKPVYIDAGLKPGKHRIRLALLDPRTGKPAIRLAIAGRQDDGWYDIGEVEVR